MLGLLNTVLSRGGSLLTYVKDGLVMANRFLTPPKLTFPADASAEFNGTSDFIDTGAKIVSLDSDFSVSFWLHTTDNLSDNSPYKRIISRGDSSGSGRWYSMMYGPSGGKLFFAIDDNSTKTQFGTSISLSPNTWYFVTNVVDRNNKVYIYVDGSLAAEGNDNTTGTAENNDSFVFSTGLSNGSFDNFSNHNLANVAIWNRALSSDEINSVMWKTYTQLATTEKGGLQAWYSLEEAELLSGDSTATLTEYAKVNKLTFEAPACVQTALNGLPDITDARLYSANYDIRVSADGGDVESLSCVDSFFGEGR